MSPDQKNKKTKTKTASGQKKTLIALLIISVILGCAVGAYFLYFSSGMGNSMKKSLNEFPVKKLSDLTTLLQDKITTREPDIVLTFQGTLMGEQGAIAIINDQMVAAGATTEVVLISEIENRKLTIDYHGEIQTLTIGETVSIRRD